MRDKMIKAIQESIDVKSTLLKDEGIIEKLGKITEAFIHCYRNGGKVLFCGNGGSAADAQHLAAELSGRFYYDRPPLPAEALHVNTSFLTAVANDYSYEEVFARMVRAMGKEGDILVGFSTSGNSSNVVKAFHQARSLSMITVGLTGVGGGKLAEVSDYYIGVPSSKTPRIQECHILIGHIICERVESVLFPLDKP